MINELGIEIKRLSLPYRLNHVNCFLAKGESGWNLIDVGVHDESTGQFWEQECAAKEIKKVIISHYHPDHYGYAGALQQKIGAEVWMPEIDAEISQRAWSKKGLDELRNSYDLAGVSSNLGDEMLINYKEYLPQILPEPTIQHFIQEGEKIAFGHYDYEVLFTPGHSPGLVTFYNAEKNVLIGTDHLLGKITPNISYWLRTNTNPLQEYFSSLEKIEALSVDYVLPSHGVPFYDANRRISAIRKHHEIRLEETLQSIKSGGTVYDTCLTLFEDKDLDIHALRSAMGETFSHLEFLFLNGECVKEKRNGAWWYSY